MLTIELLPKTVEVPRADLSCAHSMRDATNRRENNIQHNLAAGLPPSGDAHARQKRLRNENLQADNRL